MVTTRVAVQENGDVLIVLDDERNPELQATIGAKQFADIAEQSALKFIAHQLEQIDKSSDGARSATTDRSIDAIR
jgi:hypothetical protein